MNGYKGLVSDNSRQISEWLVTAKNRLTTLDNSDQTYRLLGADEPDAVRVIRRDSTSPYLFVCDHAGNRIPRKLGDLGVSEADRQRHIAWDVGAFGMAEEFARRFEATFVHQVYSRLVVDCNRPLQSATSMPEVSEHTVIPGNRDLAATQIAARQREIFHPYHDCIDAIISERNRREQATILLAIHSFTPVFKGEPRSWHIGLLYNRDTRLAHTLRDLLAEDETLCVGDNDPYSVDDESDYTIPVHGEGRAIPHALFEVRHDMIESEEDQYRWAHRLGYTLERALQRAPELLEG